MDEICLNCKRLNSEHSEKEFLYCTKKIINDLILADGLARGTGVRGSGVRVPRTIFPHSGLGGNIP